MDVHVPWAITDQLRQRGLDVITAIEDGAAELPDDQLLLHVHRLGRLIFTQDIRFKALAVDWIRRGQPFSSLIFAHPLRATIGQLVRDLELIALASGEGEWANSVEELPL